MIAKILKRKVSRVQFEAPDPSQLSLPAKSSPPTSHQNPCQYEYQRPDLLGDISEEEQASMSNHFTRKVITSKKSLPSGVGYAEVINAGKSKFNEDQASIFEGNLKCKNGVNIPYLFVGLFDGHGGAGAAIKVAKELHHILNEGLEDVLPYMTNPDKLVNDDNSKVIEEEDDFIDETVEVKMTIDELVYGALESSFWAMDRKILIDKENYKITGGTTCLVALFIHNKCYVANAGDSRAIISQCQSVEVMSRDHTPMGDRRRIQEVAFHRPELVRHPETREKLFNRHVLSRKVDEKDIGISILYKDFYMSGWSVRDVSHDDVNLIPVITGRGKQCRLLGTIGVARSLGDHDLLAKGCGIRTKEFMTSRPEVKHKELNNLNGNEVLIMGSDGFWDVMSNEFVAQLVSKEIDEKGDQLSANDLAEKLILKARGERLPSQYWELENGKLASGDDITVFCVFLQKAMK